jgi:transcriptional regulator with XRE-family HTH domain
MSLDADTAKHARHVARVLKARRQQAGVSMTRLAEMSGMSQQMISCIERGMRVPTIATLYRVARALGTTSEEVLAEASNEGRGR